MELILVGISRCIRVRERRRVELARQASLSTDEFNLESCNVLDAVATREHSNTAPAAGKFAAATGVIAVTDST